MIWPPALFVLLSLLWVWPIAIHPAAVPFPAGAEYSDLLVAHWPNAAYLRHAIWEWGELPLWNRWRLAGMPFAADPLSGMWYPPNWLLIFSPLNVGFNLLLIVHLAVAGRGMYALLRALDRSTPAAVLGAAAFCGAPKLVAHFAAGHVSLVEAVAWTPWLLLSVRAMANHGGWRRGAIAGAALATIFLADVRWAFYAGAFAAGYWIWSSFHSESKGAGPNRWKGKLKALAAFLVSFLLLTAVLMLPLLELLRQASRAELSFAEATTFSLPPTYLLGLMIPDLGGFHEWTIYSGLTVLMLASVATLVGGTGRQEWFWPAAALGALVLSLGSNTPIYAWLFRLLPGISWLRVPPRALFILGLCLVVMASRGTDLLLAEIAPRARRNLSLAAVGLSALGVMLGFLLWGAMAESLPGLPGSLILTTASGVLLWLRANDRLSRQRWAVLLGLLLAGELLWVDSSLVEARPIEAAFVGRELGARLAAKPGHFRIYSPSYSLAHQVAADYGLEQVDGVNPMQLSTFARFLERASGVESSGYSVTLPELGDDPSTANRDARPDLLLLGLLNARYVVAEFDLPATGLIPSATAGDSRIYENPAARGEAWLVHQTVVVEDPNAALEIAAQGRTAVEAGAELRGSDDFQTVPSVLRTANRVEYLVDAPEAGLLVMSEIFYPGWAAWLDGKQTTIYRVDGLLRGIYLQPGVHRVQFAFRPTSVYIGMALSIGGLFFLVGVWRRWR